jgi:hypothetical protein
MEIAGRVLPHAAKCPTNLLAASDRKLTMIFSSFHY